MVGRCRRRWSRRRSDAGCVRSSLRVWWSRVTRSRAGVPWVSGGRWVSRACWAVAIRASQSRAPWSRGSRCSRRRVGGVECGVGAGQRQQCGDQEGAVLGRAAAPEADSAGPVFGDGEVAVQVGGTFLTFQCGFEPAVDGVGVDHLGQVPPGLGELGGIQPSGLGHEHLLAAAPHQVTGRQVLDRSDDDVGLHRETRSRPAALASSGPAVRSALSPGRPVACPHRGGGRRCG